MYRLALNVQRLDGVAEAQDHDVVQQGAVELDVQHPVGADEVVDRSEGLPPGVFPGGVPVVDAVDEEDVVAALIFVPGKALRFVQQISGPSDAGRFPMNMSYLHSPIMNLSANGGKYKIHLKAHGTAGDALNVYHVGYIVDGKLTMHTATFDKDGNIDEEWEMKDGDSETMLSFEDKKLKKFFIDEVTVSQGLYKGDIITVKYDLVKLTDGKTTSYNFSGLEENKKYGYQVTGWRHNDVGGEVISGTSPIVYADLSIAAGIDDNVVANGDPKVSVSGNTVTVTLAQAAPIYVFTLDGCNKQTLSGKAGANTLTLAAGQVYIVKAGGRAYKVMAR